MKNLALISFTARGSRLCAQVGEALSLTGYCCEAYGLPKYLGETGLQPLRQSLKEWVGAMFARMDGILFIGAAQIAVRSIAPWVSSKTSDPAVVVMDETGRFAIPLLSGHLGGANELAGTLANLTGAIPVVTTATDIHGRFAVDLFARKQKLAISNLNTAKGISAAILDEKPVGLITDFPIFGAVPEELTRLDAGEPFAGDYGIVIALNEELHPFRHTLHLIPRMVTVGIGCRKGTAADTLIRVIRAELHRHHIVPQAVAQFASIDLKAKEPGMIQAAEQWEVPFWTYSEQELAAVPGEFTASEFVAKTTGVDNVCERSAVKASDGRLLQKKTGQDGVTVALAIKDWSVEFE